MTMGMVYDMLIISIHALLAESDRPWRILSPSLRGFLSTLSLRRATQLRKASDGGLIISIHALLAESDEKTMTDNKRTHISIHALLAESDFGSFSLHDLLFYFYPRSPCGERPVDCDEWACDGIFLSTLSLRRATQAQGLKIPAHGISIHALLAESDHSVYRDSGASPPFLSTLSLRRATTPARILSRQSVISIHALLAESDDWPPIREIIQWISIHALLAESDSTGYINGS